MKTKKIVLSSILTLILCLSLIAGGTFALFTSQADTNIAITSGNVEVVAWLDDIKTYTFGTVQAENTFELGGTATYDSASNKLTVDKIAPGDRVDFNVYIENKSNINVSYRVKVAFAGELQNALVANITLPDDETETVLTANDVATDWNSFNETNKVKLPMSVELPYNVGSDNMNKSAEIVVTVEAVQANATDLVMIENTRYGTFADAFAAAKTGDTIVIGGVAEYDFGTASNQTVDAKGVTVSGMDGANLVFSGDGAKNTFVNVTLKNLTVVDQTTSYAESAWELGYLEMESVVAENVVFANGIQINGTSSFTNCTFTGKTESGTAMYGACVNSGNATFTACTFDGTRGLKAHEAYGSEITAVTVDGCAFNAMSEKPGIALGTLNADTTVVLKNNTFTDTQPGDGAYIKNAGVPYQYETDTDVTTFNFVAEGNTTTLNVYTAADLWEITNVSNRVTEDGALDTNVPRYQFEGVTINIMADIDLENAEWRPICQYPDHPGFKGTINGNGHTIYNLNCYGMNGSNSVESDGLRHCQGFIGYAASGAVIKDLKFVNANVFSANSICGVVVANSLGGVTIDNCHVDGAVMESNYYIAGICGKLGDGDKVINCSVKNLTVKSWYQNQPELYSGAIYGSINNNGSPTVTDCTWENVVVQYVADTDSDGVKEVITSTNATH